MKENVPAYRRILADELKERQKRNALYSLRAFARSLGISPTMLSQILKGKRPITVQSALKIADALPLANEERQRFINSSYDAGEVVKVAGDDWRSYFVDMDPNDFRLISDPIHFAILALSGLKDRVWDAEWIAKKLGTAKENAEDAMNRLKNLNLVEVKGNSFDQSTSPRRVRSPVSETAIQNYHLSILQKAIDSLTKDPVEQREFNAVTMAISSSKLEAAKELTVRYLENIHSLLDNSEEKDKVYTIAVQIFPFSRD